MADHFEKAMQDILLKSEKNGGPTIKDVLTALSALADDADEQHIESVNAQDKTVLLLSAHCKEADIRDARIKALEDRADDLERECPERLKEVVALEIAPLLSEHHMNHPPRRSDDAKGADYTGDRRVWVMWSIGSRLTNVLVAAITALLVMGLSYAIFGAP